MRNRLVNRLFKADAIQEFYYGYKTWLVSLYAVADILTLPADLRAGAAFFCFFDDAAFIKIMICKIIQYLHYPIDL